MSDILDDNAPLIWRGRSAIGTILPHVVVEANYEDRLSITMHPVEDGATVSDHAFVMPKVVELRAAWSDSKAGFVGASRDAFDALIALQAEREPFSVSSGKRLHNNMLVAGVSVTDDEKTKHSLFASVRLQEVRIVSARTTGGGAPLSAQGMPQRTGAPVDVGPVQTVKAGPR